ncbi:MAG: hypothetical protein LC751_18400, partial [Actinobacteria bacterium]|nr:hypothetical protein [Actinomycetota bacterium]
MRRYFPNYRRLGLVLVLLPLLSFVFGFAPGAQTSAEEARRAASLAPEVEDIVSHPTVESSASYDPRSDSWEVILREDVSGRDVALLTVEDDTREVSDVEVYPSAGTVTYPEISEADATKLALADPEVHEELLN